MKKTNSVYRFFRHFFSHPWQAKRHFSAEALHNIEQAIKASEKTHAGEIRFIVETGLHPLEILYKKTPKKRALELFGSLNIWDTEHNNGVLIYLLLVDRDVEIVADRGIHKHVGYAGWEKICHDMEVMFRKGEFEAGVLQGIAEISAELEKHFPLTGANKNEISNKPLII
jgi:uncharacterized membrane protein